MQDVSGEGLPLFPEAAERYRPEIFDKWKALKAQIPPLDQRGPEWSRWSFDLEPRGTQELNLARERGRPLTEREAVLQYNVNFHRPRVIRNPARERAQTLLAAEEAARKACLEWVVGLLRRGELIARGTFYEHGKPTQPAEWLDQAGNVKPELWNEWRGGYGERIRFSDYRAKFEVRRLRVYPVTSAAPVPSAFSVHLIPECDRAPGEPGEGGCFLDAAEEQEAERSAPEILAAFRAKLGKLPRLIEEKRRALNGGGLVFVNHDFECDALREIRAPLREHFGHRRREGKWQCFGFTEGDGYRVPIRSPWRDGLTFGAGGMMTNRLGRQHSEVLFYPVQSDAAEARTAPESRIGRDAPSDVDAPKEPSSAPVFHGMKQKVWEAAQRRGKPGAGRGKLQRYIEELAKDTGVPVGTVRNYVTKETELRPYIEQL